MKQQCACGPGWLPRWFVNLFMAKEEGEKCFFHDACVQHDKDYDAGIGRTLADFNFLQHMLRLIEQSHHSNDAKTKLVLRAVNYYEWVRAFGWISYYFNRVKPK